MQDMLIALYVRLTLHNVVEAKKCIPTGTAGKKNSLSGFDAFINWFENLAGGLLFKLAIPMFIVLTVIALVMAVTKKGPEFIRRAGFVLAVPLGAIILVAIYQGMLNGANALC
jgi:hypothetical protein